MVLEVVQYGHPALRQKGARIEQITPELRRLIADMLETMYEYEGVGLAAQQVGLALQLTVVDVRGATDRPSTLEIHGQPAEIAAHMPMVLINPQVTPVGAPETGPEGCLSFPEVYGDITRPGAVEVEAQDQEGRPIKFRCGGLLARAIQHEVDHLNGILFIDRMPAETREKWQPELERMRAATQAALARKKK
ncbi:MAG: peptide deformylase [Verrucomicrobiae bacterium]|nr:peptide deformylase [Verrucomicrobiae bacterium]